MVVLTCGLLLFHGLPCSFAPSGFFVPSVLWQCWFGKATAMALGL